MSISELKEKLLKANGRFAKEYEKIDLAFEVSEIVFDARFNAGLSQAQLARKVGTQQSSIARIESGASLPSLSFLEKIAKALKTELIPPQFKKSPKNSRNDTPEATVYAAILSPMQFSKEEIEGIKTQQNNSSSNKELII